MALGVLVAGQARGEIETMAAFRGESPGRHNYGQKISVFLTSTVVEEAFDDQLYLARHRFAIRASNPCEIRALELIPDAYASAADLNITSGSPTLSTLIQEFLRRNPQCDYGVAWRRAGFDPPAGIGLEMTSGMAMPLTLHASGVTGADCPTFFEFHTAVTGAHIGDGVWGFRVLGDVAAEQICFYNDLSTITGHTFVGFKGYGQPEEVFGKYPSGSIFGSPGDFRDDSVRRWDSRHCRYVDTQTFTRALGRAYLASVNRETYNMLSSNCTSFAVEIAAIADIDLGFSCGMVCSPTEFHERVVMGYAECAATQIVPTMSHRGLPIPDAALDVDALVRLTLSDPDGAASQTLVPFAQQTLPTLTVSADSVVRILSSSENGEFIAVAQASWNPFVHEGADILVPAAAAGEINVVTFDRTGLRRWTIPVETGGTTTGEVAIVSPAGETFLFEVAPPGDIVQVAPPLLVPAVLVRIAEPFPELDGNADGTVDAADVRRVN